MPRRNNGRVQMLRGSSLLGLVLAAIVWGYCAPNSAAQTPKPGNDSAKPDRSSSPQKLRGKSTKDQELALEFVRRHLPELARLLRRLEQIDPKQYRRALSELNRQRRRLENWRRRNPKRYQLELTAWKAQQQARLLAAQLAMDPENEQLQQRLREAIRQQIHARRQVLQLEKAQLEKRLQRLEKTLGYWSDPKRPEQLFRSLVRSAGKAPKRPPASRTNRDKPQHPSK